MRRKLKGKRQGTDILKIYFYADGDDPVKRERMMFRREGRYPGAVPLNRQGELTSRAQVTGSALCRGRGELISYREGKSAGVHGW